MLVSFFDTCVLCSLIPHSQEAIFKFVACLRQHAALRNVADGAYWVCAYANNQHRLKECQTLLWAMSLGEFGVVQTTGLATGCCITRHCWQEEICANPRSTSFYRAMQLSIGIVLILDEKATPFTRIWCCFEESIAAARLNTLKEWQPQLQCFEFHFQTFRMISHDFRGGRTQCWDAPAPGCGCDWSCQRGQRNQRGSMALCC